MSREALTRRVFLQGSGTLAGSALMRAGIPALAAVFQAACSARDEQAPFENITADEAREIIAIAARILPTTDTPGATEAGVMYFVDKAMSLSIPQPKAIVREQMPEFLAGVSDAYPGTTRFSDLDEKDQDDYLRSNQDSPFFQGIRFMTMAGIFGMATWGGNRDDIGWRLLGMDGPPHAWAPPFGYYDAEYAGEQQDGE